MHFPLDPQPGPAVADAGSPAYLAKLNEGQSEAVRALDGPVLVLAGAGTGKTRVLTTRFAHILLTGRAAPSQVLAVTFTNKAAREMKDRIAGILGRPVEGLWLGTFHALCARILRRHAERVGLRSNFVILDADDQLRLVKQILEANHVDAKKWPPQALLSLIQRWKDRGLRPGEVGRDEMAEFAGADAATLYAQYQQRLQTLNAADFGDLLLHCLTLLREHADVLADYQNRFRYILVDEYQDTNVAQYLWLRLLAQGHRNICCVGDDDQSIYSWRGAEVGNILRFEKDFPGARVVRLERNYRSSSTILAAASGLIAHNEGRLGKTLWTDGNDGEQIRLRAAWDAEEEARWVGEEVEAAQREGTSLDQIAILVRAGFQMREFEDRLLALGIPYRVVGGTKFYERAEIKDARAYLQLLLQPDNDVDFERIVNRPKRGIGDATVAQLYEVGRAQGWSLYRTAAELVGTDELRPKVRSVLSELLAGFERWREMLRTAPHWEVAGVVLDDSGYTTMLQNDKSPDAPGRLDNLREMVGGMQEFADLPTFIEHVALVTANDERSEGERLNLMTLHAAKGLEFDVVFLPGWEEELFPHMRALEETGIKGLEEERRLAYVGITRA
ncbi:MAG: UvrD-helicase domain-containing protein, partial [Acetobacterales bacterium]